MMGLTEKEAISYIMMLYEIEQDPNHGKAVVSMGPWTAFSVISALQLATRHPDLNDNQKQVLTAVIDQLAPLFAGTPGEQLLELGNHAEYDIPNDCRYPFGPHSPDCRADRPHAGFAR